MNEIPKIKKNNVTFTTSEWCIDKPLPGFRTLFPYPGELLPIPKLIRDLREKRKKRYK